MAREKSTSSDILPPRENPQLFGHEAMERRFLQEFSCGLPHHAYLISGPKGIGKATLAYRMARFALNQKPAEAPSLSLFGDAPEPTRNDSLYCDPESAVFRRIATGTHSDLRTLTPTEDSKTATISVEAARTIPSFLNLTPAEGDWRVIIIDSADDLNPNAANALLKTIEEPPARALLFLISHQPERLLPTIRSRCRHYTLNAPDSAAFSQVLRNVVPSIESEEYPALYALSYGSPGYAIALHAEDGIGWYEAWLSAMHPRARNEERQKFADRAAAQKSTESWDAVLHGWRTAMHRLMLHPQVLPAIFSGDAAAINAIAQAVPPAVRRRWLEEGERLIGNQETFHLDKRISVRLLLDVAQLDRLAA